ncbi:MAG: hypothetical protein J5482_02725 [Oscillospiraceae bacterium]|nr:hypothetical protein [Oscillospiraceae bacterium]
MFFPKMIQPNTKRKSVCAFSGYDRQGSADTGALFHTVNMDSDGWPALEVRTRRGVAAIAAAPHALIAKDCLIWVDGNTLYINGEAVNLPLVSGEKQLVSMGAYLLIWPDKVYINTAQWTDCGYLEHTVSATGQVSYGLCAAGGGAISYVTGNAPPMEPAENTLWLDTGGDSPILRRYEGDGWREEEAYTAIRAVGIGQGFQTEDAVDISGCTEGRLNGRFILQAVQSDLLVVRTAVTAGEQEGGVSISRTVPDMDFIVECGNRLWGCKYGLVNGESVNEIYACKLGDFKNWHSFAGLSTDSYAASRGSDGSFTGAAVYLGSPIFFKEQCMERVYPASSGAHQIVTIQCQGVAKGSHKSIGTVEGTLYYHGEGGIYAFAGSMPRLLSQPLGAEKYHNACAGALAGKYYVSMADGEGKWHLFCYDTDHRIWYRQDNTHALSFAATDGELFCMEADTGKILALHGATGTPESEEIRWSAESNELGRNDPESGYLQRLTVYAALEPGAVMTAAVSYDGGRTWLPQSTVTGNGAAMQRQTLHVRPHRCEHLRLRLSGAGRAKIYSVSAVYGKGSDGP